jgi:uncharacterized phage protein (TIGR01671 family)
MDRFKFRGKRNDNGEWIIGDLCCMFSPENKCIMPDSFFATRHFGDDEDGKPDIEDSLAIGGFYPVKPDTVGQCTGLRDKNGMLIYEGDILRNKNSQKSHFFVKWNVGGYDAVYSGNFTLCLHPVLHEFDGAEIIGNIHENPDLLC